MTKALVTGVLGQDGSYLADLLVAKGYEVHGVTRRYSSPNLQNIQHLLATDAIHVHEADVTDGASLRAIMATVKPDEVYLLAAQSHVGTSFSQPEATLDVTGLGALRALEAVRDVWPRARVYQASSSECFGNAPPRAPDGRLDEGDRFQPASPYGAAKVMAHHLAHVYRHAYGLHVSCGLLFNHESPRRGVNFVTRKITRGLARIHHGLQDALYLGNLDAVRDWGDARDYVEAMHTMLQQDQPDDYVIATGEGHTVREFLAVARALLDVPPDCVVVDPSQRRPYDVDRLVGNPEKARARLGWKHVTGFSDLVASMVRHDRELAAGESLG